MPTKLDKSKVQVFAQLSSLDHLRLKALAIGSGRSLQKTTGDLIVEAVKDVQIPEGWLKNRPPVPESN
jgi:hypothetical protein